jgi:hypothetical protein
MKNEISKTALEKLDRYAGSHSTGCVRINPNNSLKHEMAKLKMAYKLAKLNQAFMTEAKSRDRNRRFDLINLTTGTIFEFETNGKINKGKDVITVKI